MEQKNVLALVLFVSLLAFHSTGRAADDKSVSSALSGIKKIFQKKVKGIPANPPKKKIKGASVNTSNENKANGAVPKPPVTPKDPRDLIARIPQGPPQAPQVPGVPEPPKPPTVPRNDK